MSVGPTEIPSDFDPFLEAILAQPDLLTPRLIFADYLEELGDPRANFLRWSALIQKKAAALPLPLKQQRHSTFQPLVDKPNKLRIFACLCVRFMPWRKKRFLGLSSQIIRVWDWLLPGAQSAVAASELFAADLFTANRLRRSRQGLRAMLPKTSTSNMEQAMNDAASAARYAASESTDSLSLAATSALSSLNLAYQEAKTQRKSKLMAQAIAFVQSLVNLVAETPLET